MLERLDGGWKRFNGGRRWRCSAPAYLCEVDDPGHVPSLLPQPGIAERVRRIHAFYAGRITMGALDVDGTGLDILVANAMTESYGTVPSPLDRAALDRILDSHPELPLDARLDTLLRQIRADHSTRWLVRFEPNYLMPAATPSRVSVGAHHMLLSTASALPSQRRRNAPGPTTMREHVVRLASESLYAAQLAVEYLNGHSGQHQGQLPLIAATYNAGSPRPTSVNPWHLVQFGEHIDRWIGYYNASRRATGATTAPGPTHAILPAPPQPPTDSTQLPAGSPVQPGNETLLSAHFSLAELTRSEKALQLGISNVPTADVVSNLRRLADRLEQVRALLGARTLTINSAYRCPELNRAVGSKGTSKHLSGLAADFVCPTFGSPLDICRVIAASGLAFDQLIHEFGHWVHFGLAVEGAPERRQQLTIDSDGTHVGLLPV